MSTSPTIDNINRLRLVDGIVTHVNGQEVRYRDVVMREITIADERVATQLAERMIKVPTGNFELLVSQDTFNLALTMRYCDRFECSGIDALDQTVVDLDLFATLTPLDLQAIRERVLLVEAVAQLRHGLITQEEFAQMQMALSDEVSDSKQPEGQAAESRDVDTQPVPAPERLS